VSALAALADLLGIQPHAQDDDGRLVYDPRCWFCRNQTMRPVAAEAPRERLP
jgi:hypothetical protein